MSRFSPILLIFPALAALFLCLALMDVRKHGSKMTPARKAWLRIGLIFAAVGAYLFFSLGSLFHEPATLRHINESATISVQDVLMPGAHHG